MNGFTQLHRVVQVLFLNESTVLSDDQARLIVEALRVQVHEHFAPVWGIDADLIFLGKAGLASLRAAGQTPDELYPKAWQMALLDDSDMAGALGYHDITQSGQPLGKCFLKTDIQYSTQPSVTISHELLEMLADPWIMNAVFVQSSNTAGRLYALEVCDACEDDRSGYGITVIPPTAVHEPPAAPQSVLVSDFLYPAYFMPYVSGQQLDRQGLVKSPLTLLPGGYMSYFDVPGGSGWKQLFADREAEEKAAGSRRLRRMNRGEWTISVGVSFGK